MTGSLRDNSLSEREETDLRNQDLDQVTCAIWPFVYLSPRTAPRLVAV
jgi:hypothetical protein